MRSRSLFRGLSPSSFVLLAPESALPSCYSAVMSANDEYERWLKCAQELRGRTYLADGAIGRDHLSVDGRLVSKWDRRSWHVIAREGDDACATMRFTFHRSPVAPEDLALAGSGLFSSPVGQRSRDAILSYQKECLASCDIFGEVGGWAADTSRRGSRKSAAIALSAWPICRSQGRVRAISTVTERNQSIGILMRIAAAPLRDENGELPSWNDEKYQCGMHLSVFTTWDLHSEFEADARELADILYAAPLLTCASRLVGKSETVLCR
jgi:hypothetical protein